MEKQIFSKRETCEVYPEDCDFYAEIEKGHTIKVLFDVLAEFFSRLEISISKEGISITRADQTFSVCLDTFLARDGFRGYLCKESINISFSLTTLHKLLKNVKKKENLTMYLVGDELSFVINSNSLTTKMNPRNEKISIRTQRVVCKSEESKVKPPSENRYHEPVVFDSCDFQKIKKMPQGGGGGSIGIEMEDSKYLSISDASELYSSSLVFGEEKNGATYKKTFSKDTFKKISKVTGLSTKLFFHAPRQDFKDHQNYPLYIKIKVGDLGTTKIYLKDDEQLQSGNQQNSLKT